MKAIRSQPALSTERIEKESLDIRILFDLGDEVERRFLPPIHLARGEQFRRLERIGNVTPDYLVDVYALTAG